MESVQRRALRIIYPDLSYDEALVKAGLQTLSMRRNYICKDFIDKIRSNGSTRNPLTNIVHKSPPSHEHEYCLRSERPTMRTARTERFNNFITIKYY